MRSRTFDFSLKTALLVLFFALIVLYSLFQARFIILGPHIEVHTPQDGATVDSEVVIVSGTAENITFISLNDRPIFIEKNGAWSEKLIASRGLSIITLRAKDRFGRETERTIRIVLP